jgi:catechol 2,3-dioxygenase-like lactoylglutathione lyase family enzyme
MLSKSEFRAMLPVKDLNRAKKFYADKLGLRPERETPVGAAYRLKDSWFELFPSSGQSNGSFTQGGWETDNLEREVAELRSKGVVFEEYSQPGLKTVNGIATVGEEKAAWFKDSEGNLLALVQPGNGR